MTTVAILLTVAIALRAMVRASVRTAFDSGDLKARFRAALRRQQATRVRPIWYR